MGIILVLRDHYNSSSFSQVGVVVNVVFELHVSVHVFLVVQLFVHAFAVNLLDVKSSPFSVATASPLVSLAGVAHS